MKANELMIGDWVRTNIGDLKVIILNPIYFKCGIICDKGKLYGDVDPIPITEEILNANGLIKDYLGFGYRKFSEKSFLIDIDNAEKGTLTKECQYVNEVQHALRLCGLSELADKFKLE